PLSMFSHVNTPPWTHYRQSVNYCPLFILASPASLFLKKSTLLGVFYANSDSGVLSHPKSGELLHIRSAVSDSGFTHVNTYE
ncbi:hypothetical protein, partial [Paenibacillus odorifer]|uniref:hypothetical protein n=1 Tax=Paenibacillus odorifer TaxID=189426 RepID=UPI001C4D65CC